MIVSVLRKKLKFALYDCYMEQSNLQPHPTTGIMNARIRVLFFFFFLVIARF